MAVAIALLGLLSTGLVGANPTGSLSPLATETLTPPTPLAPEDFSASPIDGLQYADPTEGLAVVQPPVPAQTGSASTSYPLEVPPGHGITPELAATYDSGAGNSWTGLGWDLSVGAITVDTTFGAPHFSATHESESYLHEGDLLVPNANDDDWEERTGRTRRDFTHQVETEYAEIIRHVVDDGGPDDYFWEVRGRDGGVRWYGGTPDSGGPRPSSAAADQPTIDEGAVIRDDNGNIVTWLLSAERDIGVNLVRYSYETVTYAFGDGLWFEPAGGNCPTDAMCGQHTYLDRILYTDATSAIADFNGPPYEVNFIRETEQGGNLRTDPVVDASLGHVDVLADRLARVEVRHAPPPATGSTRTWSTADDGNVAARWDFDYETGWFGKTLLSTITQGVTEPDRYTHELEWFNDLGAAPNTDVAGWDSVPDWEGDDDVDTELFLEQPADVSTLGGSVTRGGGGNVYIGFNPGPPSKTGSFGGALELSGADTDALVEWVDLNGDNLPDKVFTTDDGVSFRLNLGRGGTDAFSGGDADDADGLESLSANSNFGFQISFEAYPIVAVGVGVGASFTWSSHYFSDVNGDGLVDFVNGGQVLFNRLDGNGVPTFDSSSDDTPIPLDPATLPDFDSEQLDEIDQAFRVQSPPIDTVRRWVAPFDGTVDISAPVQLDAVGVTTVDGVRVAMQHDAIEFASATLAAGSASAFTADETRTVDAGDVLYFRAGSIDDGRNDRVTWSPTITYRVLAGDEANWPDDANGLSQTTWDAEQDFTLAGWPGDNQPLPHDGTVRIEVAVDLAEELSDDVELVVRRDDPVWDTDEDALASSFTDIAVTDAVIARGTSGETTWTIDVPVELRTVTTDVDRDDDGADDTIEVASALQVYVAADTPVNLNAIGWGGTITYLDAFDEDGAPLDLLDDDGAPIFEHPIRPHVEMYPNATPTTPAVTDDLPASFTGRLNVNALADDPGTAEAIVSFKNDEGTVKVPVTIGDGTTHEFEVDLDDLGGGGDYWVDVSVRDLEFTADGLSLTTLERWDDPGETSSSDIDGRLRWTGVQSVFPLAWRGWGLAGYTAPDGTAADPIDPSAFDADTLVDRSDDQPDRDDVSADESNAPPSQPYVPTVAGDGGTTSGASDVDAWIGSRDSMHGTATRMQSSRLAEDFASIASLVESGGGAGGRTAPTRLGVAGPNPTLMVGIGPFGLSAGFGPSWGIWDFEDLNGDGYPDVLSDGNVTYTDQLGSYLGEVDGPFDYVNQDLTFSVNGGLTSGLVDIPVNSKGGTNAVVGSAAAKGSAASDSGPSFGVGVSGGGGFSWTSPNASGSPDDTPSDHDEQRDALEADADVEGAAIQRAYADVNGDGLSDWVYTTAEGTFARYNLGYDFTDAAIQLGTGGFESRESATGSFGLGFSLPYGEFSGGANFLWNYDWSRYTWRDVNGDGILDQLHRIREDDVEVRFGTGSGLLESISYGDVFNVNLDDVTTSGQHVAFDRSTGIGGGGSGTAYVGPLCVIGICYLVINVGVTGSESRSSTTTDLTDVNGDGFADAVRSTNDDTLEVRLNQQNRTNLLKGVTNPLGGNFELDYTRKGNTTDHPGSVWAMTSVTVDDGRDVGEDGVDVYGQTIAYEGLDYDRTHRASLGFSRVTTTEVDEAGATERIQRQDYLNDNVFVAGLATTTTMLAPDDTPIRGSEVSWGVRDVRAVGDDFDPRDPVTTIVPADLADTSTVASRGRSIAPLATSQSQFWFDDAGARTFEQVVDYVHDGLGNVLVETDHGSGDTTDDDVVTTLTWSDCTQATVHGCLPAADATSPLAGPGTCINWASYPGRVRVQERDPGGGLVTVRERSGMTALCDNGAITEHRLTIDDGPGAPTVAVTDLTVNAYGDHELVMGPPGVDDTRYLVRYTYDADRHTDVARVEEFDVAAADAATVLANGPTTTTATAGISSSATFDPLSGRVASRTDANGATRHWRYDGLGRLTRVSEMMTTPDETPEWLVTQVYNTNNDDYAHAVASHVDSFNGNATPTGADAAGHDTSATIDTITFVDGLGRVTQTKRDARMRAPGATEAHNGRQVTGTQSFDPLARPVIDYGPVVDDGPAGDFTAAADDGKQTATSWDLADRLTSETLPGGRTTTWAYDFSRPAPSDPLLWTVTETDPEKRVVTRSMDIRGNQLVHVDRAAPRTDGAGTPIPQDPDLTTRWEVNAIGSVQSITDSAGAVTTIEHDMAGQVTAVTTPNQGRVETTWDLAGRHASTVNELMRANGTATTYGYEHNRLVAVDHPGTVDDVTYEYGLDNDDDRFTAGRVAHVDDRSRLAGFAYDAMGNVAAETVETKRHNWDDDLTEEQRDRFRTRMDYSHDQLGRIESITYPDAKTVQVVPTGTPVADLTDPSQLDGLLESRELAGEQVTHDYDSGGMVDGISGVEEGIVVAPEPINAFDDEGVQLTVDVPRPATHDYDYLDERVYDHRMLPVREEMGNTTVTTRTFDGDTKWLTAQTTTAADHTDPSQRVERQDMTWAYDDVGRPVAYANELPDANRAINGGAVSMTWTYDGFGRTIASTGSFSLKEGQVRSHDYDADFTPDAPWSIVAKDQHDQLATTKPNGDPGKVDVQELTTYSFDRTLGTSSGPLRVAGDVRTDADGEDTTYDYDYNANGAVESMLAPDDTGGGGGNGNGKGNNKGGTSETNVWDRSFTFNHLNQLTSASDGSELRTFSYDDAGRLFIQDGSLLADDGDVVHESGGGPETVFLNRWVTIRSNKIYKHVWLGDQPLMAQMDADADYETKQLYAHHDVVGSTNIVTDDRGRGFQRHEYLPSGEIWIDDRKEEIRTPFQFADGYYEDEFDIVLFGVRWYDTERELFLSPDPLLVDDPSALADEPALGAAYTYGGAAPSSNVDPNGRAFFSSWRKRDIAIRAEQDFDAGVKRGDFTQAQQDQRARRLKAAKRAKLLEPEALLKIDFEERETSIGGWYGPRKKWSWGSSSTAAVPGGNNQAGATFDDSSDSSLGSSLSDSGALSSSLDSSDATDGSGGPSVAGRSRSDGSATSLDASSLDVSGSSSSEEDVDSIDDLFDSLAGAGAQGRRSANLDDFLDASLSDDVGPTDDPLRDSRGDS